ncbi:MAG TPA: TonB-dependent receptor [Campylobacterales bacterium]|nr:TonB-dependent receptor [Campylobacterales bacterium]
MAFEKIKFFTTVACLSTMKTLASDAVVVDLTNDIHNFTNAAVKTKQNIDYLPFIMSVSDGDNLSKLGVLTLKEALMLFVGVDVSTDNIKSQSPIFRGSNPFAYGQSKLIIDGVVVNDRVSGGYTAYLDMPIEMIKRIEVVRGPGSFAEGSNGYAGTINVATYAEDGSKEGGRAYVLYGSYKNRSAGALYNAKIGDFLFHIDAYTHKDNMKISTNGKDGLSYSKQNSSLSRSGEVDIGLETSALSVAIKSQELSIVGRFTSHQPGSAFGNLNALPNEDGSQKMPSWYLEGAYKKELTADVFVETKIGYMEDGWESYARSYPAGMKAAHTVFQDGYWADLLLTNRAIYGGVSIRYDGLKNHTPKIGAYQSDEKNIDLRSITTNRITGVGWVDYTKSAPFFDGEAAKRKTTKLYLSDSWEISESLALSFELGSDKASDFERQNDYRAALVWQISDSDILKTMTSTAYRAPSWQELYSMNNAARIGSKNLKPERVRAYEAQYIKKLNQNNSLAINLFFLQNKNQINKINAQNQYRNAGDSLIYGVETEYKKEFSTGALYMGYSFLKGKTNNEDSLPSAARRLFKGSALKKIYPGFSIAGNIVYVGDKKRVASDNRDETPSYTTIDAIINYDAKKWGAQFGVKNATNTRALYPSEQGSYPGDYPTSKQTLFVKLFGRF